MTRLTKYFALGSYEKEVDAVKGTRELYYIYTPSGLSAILESKTGGDSIFYIHNDILGSFDVITNSSGTAEEWLSFDPWGRRRSTDDWDFDTINTDFRFDRGFTGHQHLDDFGIINMNGRVYDPLLAIFLSPDPFIQSPENVQNFNRYTYCFNNPFKYIDPSGFSAYEDYMNSHYGEGNYWYRGQAPGTWGSSSGSFGGDFSTGAGSGYFGAPGQGLNGTGLGGVYYDWYSGTYRSTGFGYNQFTWWSAYRIISDYSTHVSAIIYAGTESNPYEVFRGLHFDDGSTWYIGEGFTPSSNSASGQGGYETISFSELAPEQDFSGFWGGVKYFWTGGNIDGYHYNMNGKATGFAPIMGMPPSFIGGPLRKGEQAVKLGKYLFNPSAFHAVKKGVLSFANPENFAHIVGRNPNLMFKGGKIWLTGTKTGGYFGKTYETGMTIADFLKLF